MFRQDQHRKFFDSGDYALSKAGVAPQNTVGTAIPNPEKLVHYGIMSNNEVRQADGSALLAYPMHLPAMPIATVTRVFPFHQPTQVQ